jgi:hypothetical protein
MPRRFRLRQILPTARRKRPKAQRDSIRVYHLLTLPDPIGRKSVPATRLELLEIGGERLKRG